MSPIFVVENSQGLRRKGEQQLIFAMIIQSIMVNSI